jgi:hypothetical protein
MFLTKKSIKLKKAGLYYFLLPVILTTVLCKKETGTIGPAGL